MNSISKKKIKNLFKKYQIYPLKKFGQNFLINKKIIKKIIKTADFKAKDFVLEIGPGIGNLTIELAKKVKKVIAIEKDIRMFQVLKDVLESYNIKNVEIIKKDILKIRNWKLKFRNLKVVVNLPYYIVSPVIRKFLELKNQPTLMVLMVQKEIAQRICVLPPKMNLLAISVQFFAKPEVISFVSKKCFWPEPKVDSAIIKIASIKNKFENQFKQKFFKIIKAGFSQPRKQLVNNLSKMLKLEKEKVREWLLRNKINPQFRAQVLSIENWKDLTKTFIIK